jgi:hypothetical protein
MPYRKKINFFLKLKCVRLFHMFLIFFLFKKESTKENNRMFQYGYEFEKLFEKVSFFQRYFSIYEIVIYLYLECINCGKLRSWW